MSAALTEFEHAFFIGNYMSGILYGVQLVMFFVTLRALFHSKNHWHSNSTSRSRFFFALYITTLTLLLTIDITVNSVWGEKMWIEGRNGVGGVPGFIGTQTSVWYQTLGSTSVVAMIFMGDALLLFRLFVIYGSRFTIIVVPGLAYLAALALAIIELVIAGEPGGNFFHGKAASFGVPYYALTISLNVIVTLLICFRLWKLGSVVSKALGRESAKMYTSVASILVESAAPYSMVGLMFLVPYALGSGTAIGFGQVWAKLACIAPSLIVLRVVTGRAWGRQVVTQAESGMEFGQGLRQQKGLSTGVNVELHSRVHSEGNTTVNGNTSAAEKWNVSTKSFESR
ncbi:hypothetical protein CPB83DRAFT_854964 [Crepidotus variabilis]|uniref:Uncharacterized protein n=1 Tax=Crepidotus variabilis TaxID=179855 RepID=A0A9P6EFM9_9AGAR|nr:hypothetical protein CPB83DRAFT_854964 [Crepidotus variabilis]